MIKIRDKKELKILCNLAINQGHEVIAQLNDFDKTYSIYNENSKRVEWYDSILDSYGTECMIVISKTRYMPIVGFYINNDTITYSANVNIMIEDYLKLMNEIIFLRDIEFI